MALFITFEEGPDSLSHSDANYAQPTEWVASLTPNTAGVFSFQAFSNLPGQGQVPSVLVPILYRSILASPSTDPVAIPSFIHLYTQTGMISWIQARTQAYHSC